MKTVSILLAIIISSFLLTNCDEDDNNTSVPCGQYAIISNSEYSSAPTDFLIINSLSITGECFTINFSASGCSGDTWEVKLIDSGAIMESYPLQRNLILSLKNEEECEAFITKEMTFDISNLQVDDNPILLNITNTDDQILYEY